MKEVRIQLYPLGRTLKARSGTSLIDVLHAYGVEFPCGGKGICGKCRVRLLKGDIPLDAIHRKKLQDLHLDEKWRLACMSRVQEDIVLEVGQYVTPVMAGDEEFEFTPVSGFGVAVDVGTTTLVAQLLDLSTGRVLGVETGLNPQRKTGSDLISRLEYAREHGAEELRDVIREQVERMIRNLLVPEHDLPQKVILVGNTVMQHLFCGLDVSPLSYYPFESDHLGIHCFSASELGWDLPLKQICFYPSVGSFVGSDVLAGIHAIGMASSPDYQVLVDLGTNGEIAVGNRDRILVASTAAGPAFEGAKISQGMLATTGAISSIRSGKQGFECQVIGQVPARGICGSALIDAIALGMESGMLGSFGEIQAESGELMLRDDVRLTQSDIQEFLLAKAAIATGLEILIQGLDIAPSQISRIFIAGAFGSYIHIPHMMTTGMMNFPVEKIQKMGNLALMGAKMFLFSGEKTVRKILHLCSHVNLEGHPAFQDIFISHLSLQPPSTPGRANPLF